ncbi:MAG TPA: hypothetical protein VFZ89_07970, partial [Solirubrobacteraceae bacterium]
SAVSDAARSSVRAMGSVGTALRDTIGVRGRSAPPPAEPARYTSGAAALIDEIAGLLADFLDRAGGAAQNAATGIDERSAHDPTAPPRKELELFTAPGATAHGKFTIWNRGDVKLEVVGFKSTSLLGPYGAEIVANRVSFDPDPIKTILPRQGEEVIVSVDVPAEVVAGTYHGLVRAMKGSASVLLHLEVKGAPVWPAHVVVEETPPETPA